jgi:2-oxoglutarate dehydrogenase complex dehydrogenase (E1) component-like enzyme
MAEREKRKAENTAFIRLERLCPFPVGEIREALLKYKNVTSKSLLRITNISV